MAKKILVLSIVGKRALLCHSTRGMKVASNAMAEKHIPTPEVEAELGLYVDPGKKGRYFFPTIGVRNAIISAAKAGRKKFGKISAASVVSSALFPAEEFVPLLDPETEKPLDKYEIDIRPAVVQKARIMRARPKFPKWALKVPFEVDVTIPQVVQDGVLELANLAGDIIGLGDYRIQRSGLFGQFTASWEK